MSDFRGGAHLKTFGFIVMGDASEVAGLLALYDEEDTDQVLIHERLDAGVDLFDFWQKNANTDQVSGRVDEPRNLEPEKS